MLSLTGARLISAEGCRTEGCRAEIGLDRGFRPDAAFSGPPSRRLLIMRPGGLRMPRTWSLSPELAGGADPIDGRDRLDLTGFPGTAISSIGETATDVTIETEFIRLAVRRSPLALTWSFRADKTEAFQPVLQDRPTEAYCFERAGPRFVHYLVRDPRDHYYGFGEKSGDANKHGRRLRMRTADALGYDAETSDPLYKHIPFYITVRPASGAPVAGLFYDNLSHGAFDLGQEIDAYHGPYRSFEASDGDLDLYLMFGRQVSDVVTQFTALTGRTAFPPRWSLSYSGSTMQYTEAADAEAQLAGFLARLQEHGIPCRSFHLSSGYTKRDDKRYVFTWDRARFPDPAALAQTIRRRRRAPRRECEARDAARPSAICRGGKLPRFHPRQRRRKPPAHRTILGRGSSLSRFHEPADVLWWAQQVKAQLLDNGIASTWNDNNEFEVWDDSARADLNGRGGAMACLRPVQTGLMLRASALAQQEHAPRSARFS